MPWGGAPKCPGCERSVYPMDQVIAADRKPFHNRCIRCQMFGCGNELTARTIHQYEGVNICEKCHDNIYRNKVYGPPEGGESLEERRRREEEERLAREQAERSKRDRKCMECDKKTFPEDSDELSPGMYYHKTCMKCSACERKPEDDDPLIMGNRNEDDVFGPQILDPYCKFCYAKKFKMSAVHIQEIVTIAPELAIGL